MENYLEIRIQREKIYCTVGLIVLLNRKNRTRQINLKAKFSVIFYETQRSILGQQIVLRTDV